MSMNISTDYRQYYSGTDQTKSVGARRGRHDNDSSVAASKNEKGATVELSSDGIERYKDSVGTFEKSSKPVAKMSETDRASLVEKLKADQERRQSELTDLVSKMMGGQAKSYGLASDDDSIWKFLAKGDFNVDAATKARALDDISENGFYGVKQTSQRLFDFASALAGDDVEKMKKMQAAMEKGFRQAEKAWGGSLPSISHETMSAANKLFEDYYASKKESNE